MPVTPPTAERILVAGLGNIFLSDDGFGVEVLRRLAERTHEQPVRLLDIGIRGIHLVHEVLDGCAALILIDAAPRGARPGTISVIDASAEEPGGPPLLDPHDLAPDEVLRLLQQWGHRPARIWVVACEPLSLSPGIGLSPVVRERIDVAVAEVERVIADVRRTVARDTERELAR